MNSRIDIQSELSYLNSSLPFDLKQPVFDVPEGFFENFAAGVLAKIKGEPAVSPSDELASLSPLLAGISRKMPYAVPENYFQGVTKGISGITEEEPVSEILQEAGKSMPYTVPDRYFDQLPHRILAKVSEPKAKIISIDFRKRMRYAVAAVVAGLITLGGILYLQEKPVDPVKQPDAWFAKKLKNVSNQDLEEFINATTGNQDRTRTAQNETRVRLEVKKMLQDVPDNELDAFLSQVPTDSEELSAVN